MSKEKPRNLLDPEAIYHDSVAFRDKLAKFIEKYRHVQDTTTLEALLEKMDRDLAKRQLSDNPDRWAYRGASREEFEGIVKNGIRTEYTDQGRGVLFTRNPRVAWARKGAGGQLLRFSFPVDGEQIKAIGTRGGAYEYNHFTPKAINRRDVEVFLDGDLDDDSNWVPAGALR